MISGDARSMWRRFAADVLTGAAALALAFAAAGGTTEPLYLLLVPGLLLGLGLVLEPGASRATAPRGLTTTRPSVA
jgi:hypothetical protein